VVLTVHFLRARKLEALQGIDDGAQMPLRQMQVFRRRFQIAVPQYDLNGAQICPPLQKVSGEAVPPTPGPE